MNSALGGRTAPSAASPLVNPAQLARKDSNKHSEPPKAAPDTLTAKFAQVGPSRECLTVGKTMQALDVPRITSDGAPPVTDNRILHAGAREHPNGGTVLQVGKCPEFNGFRIHFDKDGMFESLGVPDAKAPNGYKNFEGDTAEHLATALVNRTEKLHQDTQRLNFKKMPPADEAGFRRQGVGYLLNAVTDAAGCGINTYHQDFEAHNIRKTIDRMTTAVCGKLAGPTTATRPQAPGQKLHS